ncbi:MAG: carbamoyl phosphate synthase large subunit, partial [Acidobacteriota bacterium]|nr:carbamoyl phosphate synthase large subunit [Acidobacteriota bacterium]
GEVMGVAADFPMAFAKAQLGAGTVLPTAGLAFLSVNDNDKPAAIEIARALTEQGFGLIATKGTRAALLAEGFDCEEVYKVLEGRPNIVDRMKNGDVAVIVNTPLGRDSYHDETAMRIVATQRGIPLITTLSGAHAMVQAVAALRRGEMPVESLQSIYEGLAQTR